MQESRDTHHAQCLCCCPQTGYWWPTTWCTAMPRPRSSPSPAPLKISSQVQSGDPLQLMLKVCFTQFSSDMCTILLGISINFSPSLYYYFFIHKGIFFFFNAKYSFVGAVFRLGTKRCSPNWSETNSSVWTT